MSSKTIVSLEQAKIIQEALHRLANSPNFSHSTFLKIVQQQIQKISDEFDETIEQTYLSDNQAVQEVLDDPNKQAVFISVYCSDGSKIDAWQRVITNLPKQYISRPIYLREQDAQKALKAKAQFLNEAYVSVLVDKKNIFSTENDLFNLHDKFGSQLLTLKDRSIELSNIVFFWHNSKQYSFKDGNLSFFKTVPDFLPEE
jgi:intracellular multiplication protein IcmQ